MRRITKQFGGVVALNDVSLELFAGERLALIGENGAGKTSLMNVLYGLYHPDSGEVCFDGVPVKLKTPADAIARGVGMVHQHFTLVPALSVVENIVLGSEPVRFGVLDMPRAIREVEATCAKLGFALDLHAPVGSLTVGSQQKVEIVKALHRGVTTLILDEPTAVLTRQEAIELFVVTERLAGEGLSVVLISHKLRDVMRFASRIAVMRAGQKVAEVNPGETSTQALAQLMVAGPLTHLIAEDRAEGDERVVMPGPKQLEVSSLEVNAKLHGVSFAVHAGEIVGIAGVDGNGQRELAEAVTGLRAFSGGTVSIDGVVHRTLSPRAAREAGVAHVPEDRHRLAMVTQMSVEENVALGRHRRPPFAKGGRIDFKARHAAAAAMLERYDVRPRAPGLHMGALSGGNQQKLVIGRELDSAPAVLVVVQPTRGLDIAAVEAVRSHLLAARARGCAVLLLSLDLDEVLALCDRVLVMFEGRVMGELRRGEYDEQRIGRLMLGVTSDA